jgi:hypothetical protein
MYQKPPFEAPTIERLESTQSGRLD